MPHLTVLNCDLCVIILLQIWQGHYACFSKLRNTYLKPQNTHSLSSFGVEKCVENISENIENLIWKINKQLHIGKSARKSK